MAYCTAFDVRTIINTVLTDDEITSIIETSDAEIDRRVGTQSASDKLIKKLSMLLTAQMIKTRQPQSQAIGDYREEADDILDVWDREIEGIFGLYRAVSVRASTYGYIDESERRPEG